MPGAALRETWREGYHLADLRRDALAGVVVGIVALPLAMALAVAVGAPPQYGLYTAIVGGFLTAALGGSRTQVTGPTAAFVVILAPIYAQNGLPGLLLSGVLAGVILILMAALRLGRLIEFVPHPVTTGFTAGIGTVIATLQIKDMLGLHLAFTPNHFIERVLAMGQALPTASGWEALVGVFTLAVLVRWPRVSHKVPPALIALPAAAVLAALLELCVPGAQITTISERFSTIIDGQLVAGIPRRPPMWIWPWAAPAAAGQHFVLSLDLLRDLLPGAFAIAMLGAIESLLSAVVADGMTRTRHNPDAEILGLGIANVLTPFFGGIPATGAIARTATNIRSGGRSPVAAMVHSVTVLLAVLALAPAIGTLPMSSLAALLLLVAWNMSEVKHFMHMVRVAPRPDVAVLLTCYGLTVIFDMVIAVTVGVVLAALLFMQRMAEVTQARFVAGDPADGSDAATGSVGKLPPGVVVYDISGPLFFGAAQKAMAALGLVDKVRAVVLRLDHVPAMDWAGLVALESALAELQQRGTLVAITGLQAQPASVLANAHIEDQPGKLMVRKTLAEALAEIGLASGPPVEPASAPP